MARDNVATRTRCVIDRQPLGVGSYGIRKDESPGLAAINSARRESFRARTCEHITSRGRNQSARATTPPFYRFRSFGCPSSCSCTIDHDQNKTATNRRGSIKPNTQTLGLTNLPPCRIASGLQDWGPLRIVSLYLFDTGRRLSLVSISTRRQAMHSLPALFPRCTDGSDCRAPIRGDHMHQTRDLSGDVFNVVPRLFGCCDGCHWAWAGSRA